MEILKSVIPTTHEGRLAELKMWVEAEITTVPFSDMHKRFEGLLGRPVWTHEFAHPKDLIHELETKQPATFAEVIQKVEDYVGKGNVIIMEVPHD